MSKRNVVLVILFSLFIPFYALYWTVSTKNEMNRVGAEIPTAWLILVPFVNFWWMYKYFEGVGVATRKEMSGLVAFLLMFFLGGIGAGIVQISFNKVADMGAAQLPAAQAMY